ncbi:enoyl-CoA hydratase [Gordonia terrae]|uniref:enoyl-CoA hydratase n=1 Tax=Gordonia terrae TaxID=2055 RepID=UPI00200A4A80|nr:enoyl-CoA hydratase [Gordonia terrae]UPW08599.1 enoyl-CoA hydratase [Gordonia terrae]
MTTVLHTEKHGTVRLVTLNRPDARNSLSAELVGALSAELRSADADPTVRAIVLTGTDPAFCAGLDLKALAADGADYLRIFEDDDVIRLIGELHTPVIGAVNGAAFTGGLEMALGCDFLVASERAVFADTHARVGVLPGGGLTARLPDRVGTAWARRMSFTGDLVDARLAVRIGLVTEVVPHADLIPHVLGIASRVTDAPGAIMGSLKHMYAEGWAAVNAPVLDVEHRLASAETPDWSGLENNRRQVLDRNRSQLD